MKVIKIKFVGFWEEWDPENNFITNTLRKFCNPILSDNPDYLFSSCFSNEYMDYDCVRVFFTGENICPDFNVFDYAIGFEEMDFGDRYLRYPLYLVEELYGDDYSKMLEKHIDSEQAFAAKTEFCSFVVSNGSELAGDFRTEIFKKLSGYKKVNSGGRFLNNIGQPEGVKDKLEFQSKHKFSICFENSVHPGYITEKLVQGFAARTVPIYYGDRDVSRVFNRESFINCHEYESFEEAIKKVIEIDQNDEEYKKILSTPALVDGVSHKEAMNEKLELFLKNVVLQKSEEAVRTNRLRYGREYLAKEKEKELAQRELNRSLHRIISKIYEVFK